MKFKTKQSLNLDGKNYILGSILELNDEQINKLKSKGKLELFEKIETGYIELYTDMKQTDYLPRKNKNKNIKKEMDK